MSQTKCRILCVDDHDDTSEMLQLLFTSPDYDVRTARTVEEALSLAKSEEFDLYVLDKRLPDGTGLELCQELNALTPGIPCILYTGDAYEVHRQEALRAGADAFVAKPDLEGLINAVKDLLAKRECAATTHA
ncbi:MAG TPA: response regulator [Pyrinomonadaceae bacterium]|nr:response regulator [Pyrinomonadaceae bacterium]